jgi:hypothetical protein
MNTVPVNQVVRTESPHSLLNRVYGVCTDVAGGLQLSNLSAQIIPVTAPGANTEFAVNHTLGRIPQFYWFNSDRACNVYQLASTGTPWTATTIYLKCSVSGAVLQLVIL